MRLNMKITGLNENVERIVSFQKFGVQARNRALRDTGNWIRTEVKKERKNVTPLGYVSKKIQKEKGNNKPYPWQNSRFTVRVFARTGTVRISTQGANRIMEEGGTVTMSDAYRRYLHWKGIHLRNQNVFAIPARPIFGRAYSRIQGSITNRFENRFFHHLEFYTQRELNK